MSYFPMFIPIYSGGGGGGPMGTPQFIVLLGILGGTCWIYNKNIKPRAELQIRHTKYAEKAIYVRTKEYNYPQDVKSTIINGGCLDNKGYNIISAHYSNYNNKYYYIISRKDGKPIDKKEFLADCKECDVKTKIQYKYTTIFLSTKKVKKEVAWHDAFQDRLE